MSASTFHIPFIQSSESYHLTAMVTSKKDAAAQTFPNVICFSSLDELLAHHRPDLVVLATPNHLHYAQAVQVLEAGCHVLIDKPFVVTVAQGESLISLAERCSKHIFVYHNRRWDGDFLTLKSALDDGRLGNVKVCTIQFDRFRPKPRERWRESDIEGAGIWFDLGPHLVDQALVLFGRPNKVQARLETLRQGSKCVDFAQVQLLYSDKEVVLRTSPYTADPMLRYQVETDRGTWRKYGLDPQEDRLKEGYVPTLEDWLPNEDTETAQWSSEQGIEEYPIQQGNYMRLYEGIAHVVLGNTSAMPVNIQQALDVVKVMEAAIESENSQRRITLYF